MTVTEPCTSPTIAALSPDLRVNYTFGMVLGLDEFVQEQFHQQEKDALHRRLLHGYGTSYGLAVTSNPTADDRDFVVTVSPGAGVDQWGREFVVREPQTARIGPWLADQIRQNPDLIDLFNDSSGTVPVYVVASYASCLDNVVSLPGQACGQPAQAPSRTRDSWKIELRVTPPPTPRWDLDRRMADLLNSVVLEPTNSFQVGHFELAAAVRALKSSPDEPIPIVRVGQPDYREAFDNALSIWNTEIRPQLAPDLLTPDPASDPAIPLAIVGIQADRSFDVDNPVVRSALVEDVSRPVLVSSQLAQEATAPYRSVTEPTRIVTLFPAPANARPYTVTAWLNVPTVLNTPATIPVVALGPSGIFQTYDFTVTGDQPTPAGAALWILTAPTGFTPVAGHALSILFDTVTTFGGESLTAYADRIGLILVDDVTALTVVPAGNNSTLAPNLAVASTPVAEAAAEQSVPAEFVTITDVPAGDGQLGFELWFHPEPHGGPDATTVTQPQVRVVDAMTGDPVEVSDLTRDPLHGNVWTLSTERPHEDQPFPAYLRFVFPADGFELSGPASGSTGLADWIGGGAAFVGWDAGQAGVVAHHRVAAPAGHAPGRSARKAAKPRAGTDTDKDAGSTPR